MKHGSAGRGRARWSTSNAANTRTEQQVAIRRVRDVLPGVLKRESAENITKKPGGVSFQEARGCIIFLHFFFFRETSEIVRDFFQISPCGPCQATQGPLGRDLSPTSTCGGGATAGAQYLFSARGTEKCVRDDSNEVSGAGNSSHSDAFLNQRFSFKVCLTPTQTFVTARHVPLIVRNFALSHDTHCSRLCLKPPPRAPGDRHGWWSGTGSKAATAPGLVGPGTAGCGDPRGEKTLVVESRKYSMYTNLPYFLCGPTSSRKPLSDVWQLATRTQYAHRFVRINNHSTLICKYLGSYVTDAEGSVLGTRDPRFHFGSLIRF